jgi:hypothetical protein
MKILLIYEQVPESTDTYLLDVTPEDWAWIRLTHGCFINSTEMPSESEEACQLLMSFLEGKEKLPQESGRPLLLRSENVDYFVHTGFIL